MKKLVTTLAMLVTPVVAHASAIQDQCSPEAKQALYVSFRQNYKTDQAKANDDARKYLQCPIREVTESEQSVINYLKKWTAAYDEAARKASFKDLLYAQRKYPEAYAVAGEILSKEPDNLKVLVDLGVNAYLVASNTSLSPQALDYARRALQQLESGKTLDDWVPLPSREVAIAYLNYSIGTLTLSTDPTGAVKYLWNSVQTDSPLRKSPYTYSYIAGAYETGEYSKQADAYKTMSAPEGPVTKLALANINQIIDRMIDGYARAVALAGADAQFASHKTIWMDTLTTFYKYRNNGSDAGLSEFIVSVMSKPLPPLPTKLTALPQ